MIRKRPDGWVIFSKDGSTVLEGPFASREEANRREAYLRFMNRPDFPDSRRLPVPQQGPMVRHQAQSPPRAVPQSLILSAIDALKVGAMSAIGVTLFAVLIVAGAVATYYVVIAIEWAMALTIALSIALLLFALPVLAALLLGTVCVAEWKQAKVIASGRIALDMSERYGLEEHLRWWPWVAALSGASTVALLVAMLPINQYTYYVALRWLVSVSAVGLLLFTGRLATRRLYENEWTRLTLIAIALLWNPILPVHSSKTVWVLLDYVAVLALVSFVLRTEGLVQATRDALAYASAQGPT